MNSLNDRRLIICERVLLLALLFPKLRSIMSTSPRLILKGVFNSVVSLLSAAVPGVQGVLDSEKSKALSDIERDMLGEGDPDAYPIIPEKGIPAEEILRLASELKRKALTESGKKWGGIYHSSKVLTDLQSQMWSLNNSTNSLYPGTFPFIRKYEAELISMVVSLVAPSVPSACGLLSSGGTESILLAALAYRQSNLGINDPEIIAAETAHPAIHKACTYFKIKLIKAPVSGTTSYRLTPSIAKKYITRNTVAIYASAPTFPHGIVDDISGLSDLALKHKIGLHVDNCLGGFLLSYLSKLGSLPTPFDFSIPGVTTMSVDLHKYGGSAKGASVCIFRDGALRKSTYVPSWDGCEGLYVTPTIQGSRSGATIAAAWASVLNHGEDGYLKMAREHRMMLDKAEAAVGEIDGLEMLVRPDAAIVPIIASKGSGIDIYKVASQMEHKGWNLFTGQHPPVLGLCVGEVHKTIMEDWIADLTDAVAHVKANPDEKATGNAAVYGSASTIPDNLLDDILRSYVDISLTVKPA